MSLISIVLLLATAAVGNCCFVSGPSPLAHTNGSPGMSATQLYAVSAARVECSAVKLGTKQRCTSDSRRVYASGGGGVPAGPTGLMGSRTFSPVAASRDGVQCSAVQWGAVR